MATNVFWTGLFTFGGGLVGALGTYWGSRSQRDLRLRELELELGRQGREEAHQARREINEECENRRRVYLKYLGALDGVVHATSIAALDRDGLGKRWADFVAADDEVELGGTEAVKEASYPLHHSVRKVMKAYATVLDSSDEQWPQDALEAWNDLGEEFNETRADVVQAMREDLLSALALDGSVDATSQPAG